MHLRDPRDTAASSPTSAGAASSIYSLISRVEDIRGSLSVVDGKLRVNAEGAIAESLREQLEQNHDAVVAALSEPSFHTRAPSTRVPILEFYRRLWTYVVTEELGVWFSNAPQSSVRIRQRLELQSLQSIVDLLVDRHVILGSKVVMTESGAQFEFGRRVSILFEDLSATVPDSLERVATQRASEHAWRPFDTENEPFFRFYVLKLAEADFVVGFVIHHFIADASSELVLAQELAAAYAQMASGSAKLPGTPLQYADYVTGYNEWLSGPALPFRLAYWNTQMRDAPASRLPPDHEIGLDESSGFSSCPFRFDSRTTVELRDLARRMNSTLFVMFLAAQVSALSQILATSDIVILIMHHGRDTAALAGMIGSTQNQLPVRIRMTDGMSFKALTAEVSRACVAAYRHQLPYHYVREGLSDIGTPNLFSEMHFRNVADPSASASARQSPGRIERFEVTSPPQKLSSPRISPGPKLALFPGANEIGGAVDYLTALYEPATIAGFIEIFRATLSRAAQDPTQPAWLPTLR